jgi:hypothetical protein
MLAIGAARYLFPLDLDHAHLASPSDLWEKKYSKLPRDKALPALLEEPGLAALYHTAEHLTTIDPKTGQENTEAKAWRERRNVLGFYDGRPIEILPSHPTGIGVGVPEGYESFAGFNFLASPKGQLYIFLATKAIPFDITFEIGDIRDEEFPAASTAKRPSN